MNGLAPRTHATRALTVAVDGVPGTWKMRIMSQRSVTVSMPARCPRAESHSGAAGVSCSTSAYSARRMGTSCGRGRGKRPRAGRQRQGGGGVETAGGVAARPPAEAHAGRRRRAARKRAPAPCNMYIIHRVKHDDFAAGGQQLVRAAGAEEIRQRRADARHGGGGRQRRRGGVGGRLLGAQQRRRIWWRGGGSRRRPRSRGRLAASRRHFL